MARKKGSSLSDQIGQLRGIVGAAQGQVQPPRRRPPNVPIRPPEIREPPLRRKRGRI